MDAWVGVFVCVYVSTDTILRFINALIIIIIYHNDNNNGYLQRLSQRLHIL